MSAVTHVTRKIDEVRYQPKEPDTKAAAIDVPKLLFKSFCKEFEQLDDDAALTI